MTTPSSAELQPRRFEPVDVARMFDFVREAQSQGQNRGLWVEGIQHIAGGATGDSWCVEFGWVVFTIAYAGHCPWPRMQSCEDVRMFAERSGWVVTDPQRNDIVLHLVGGRAHHFGIVTEPDPLSSIAGNTSEDGSSPNGDRVAEHAILTLRERLVFIRFRSLRPLDTGAAPALNCAHDTLTSCGHEKSESRRVAGFFRFSSLTPPKTGPILHVQCGSQSTYESLPNDRPTPA